MSIVYKELINSMINKLSSSIKKSKRPVVSVNINGHIIKALYDTGADLCCMTAAKFRQVFPVNKRPKKLNLISSVTVASGDKIECMGVYPNQFEIDKKKFVYNVHVLNNLCDDFILGLNFFQHAGLTYDPENHELFWTEKNGAN
jgi:predicted aspartyl protease